MESKCWMDKLRYVPTSYYGVDSGVGRAIRAVQARGSAIRVGVIGLGAGVLSTYGREGDYYRIYEINPLVPIIATTQFSFYPHSRADKQIMMGDARLTLERQQPQNFDVLAVDAFSSDAIPIHLLTREALAFVFPSPEAVGHSGAACFESLSGPDPGVRARRRIFPQTGYGGFGRSARKATCRHSTWVLLTSEGDWFKTAPFSHADMDPATAPKGFRAWTDDYSNVFQILKLD